MSGSTMDSCVQCSSELQDLEQHYHLKDLGSEFMDILENLHPSLDINNKTICKVCFEGLLNKIDAEQKKFDFSKCPICLSSIRFKRSHSLPSGPERDLLEERIYPKTIPAEALVCYNCWSYARRINRTKGIPSVLESPKHLQCVDCCRILGHHPFHVLMDGPEKTHVALKIAPREVPAVSRICRRCWLCVKNDIKKQLETSAMSNSVVPVKDNSEAPLAKKIKTEPLQEFPSTATQETIQTDATVPSIKIEIDIIQDIDEDIVQDIHRDIVQDIVQDSDQDIGYNLIKHCIRCGKPLSGTRSHPLPDGLVRNEIAAMISPLEVHNNSRVCHSCWLTAKRNATKQPPEDTSDTWTLNGFKRTADTAARCFVPKCKNLERSLIPYYFKKEIFKQFKLFITSNARVCEYHKILDNCQGIWELPFSSRFSKAQVQE